MLQGCKKVTEQEKAPDGEHGIIGFGFEAGQSDHLVGRQIHGFIDGSRRDPARSKIRLGPDDEEHVVPMKSVESGEVEIAAVQDVEGTGLQREIIEDSDIVRFSIRHIDKRGYRAPQIEKRMELYGSFALAELAQGKSERHKSIVVESKAKTVSLSFKPIASSW